MSGAVGRYARWVLTMTLAAAGGCRHEIQPPANPPPGAERPPSPVPGGTPGVPQSLVPSPEQRDVDVQWGRISVNVTTSDGVVTSSAEMVHPKLWVFRQPQSAEKAAGKTEQKAKQMQAHRPYPLADFESMLRTVLPADLDRLAVYDAEVVTVDMTQKDHPQLWVHDVAISVENLATRRWLTQGRPVLVAMSGIVQGSGRLTAFVSADPFGKELNFAGRASLVGLQTRELYAFIDAAAAVQAPVGTIDVYVEFSVQHGIIQGGVKAMANNLVVTPSRDSAWSDIKAWMADAAIGLTANAVPGKNAVGTVIPISGKLDDPKAQLWPTLMGVLRNAFVEGLSSSFSQVPPKGRS